MVGRIGVRVASPVLIITLLGSPTGVLRGAVPSASGGDTSIREIPIAVTVADVSQGPVQEANVWPQSLDQERQLASFEDAALSAGALGFYRDSVGDLVVLEPASVGAIDTAALGSLDVPVATKQSPLQRAVLDRVRDELHLLPAVSALGADSLAFYFDAEYQKFEVTTSISAGVVASVLGDDWAYVDYHQGKVIEAGRFSDTAPFRGGAAIDFRDWAASYYDCTSGFTVVNSSGQRGLVTAAHCGPLGSDVLTRRDH